MQRNRLLQNIISKLEADDPEFLELVLHHNWNNREYWVIQSHSDVLALASVLKRNTTLQSIHISGKHSGRDFQWLPDQAQAIGEAIKDHPSLNSINIDIFEFDGRFFDMKNDYQRVYDGLLNFLHGLTGTAKIKSLRIRIANANGYFIQKLSDFLSQSDLSVLSIQIDCLLFLSDSKEQDFSSLAQSIAKQTALNTCELHFFNPSIGHSPRDYRALAASEMIPVFQSLSLFNSLKSLSIKVESADSNVKNNISSEVVKILENNNQLVFLALGVGCELKNVIPVLPNLKHLECLRLSHPDFSDEDLRLLYTFFHEKNSNIFELCLTSFFKNKFMKATDAATLFMINILTQPGHLRQFSLDFHFTNEQIIQMMPFLKTCQFQSLQIYGSSLPNAEARNNLFLELINENKSILDLFLDGPYEELTAILNERKLNLIKENRQKFIDGIICLYNAFYNPANQKTNFGTLPIEVLNLVVNYIGSGMGKNAMNCSQLIRENMSNRRQMIIGQQYDSKAPDPNIAIWWDKSNFFKTKKIIEQKAVIENKKTETSSDKKNCVIQ